MRSFSLSQRCAHQVSNRCGILPVLEMNFLNTVLLINVCVLVLMTCVCAFSPLLFCRIFTLCRVQASVLPSNVLFSIFLTINFFCQQTSSDDFRTLSVLTTKFFWQTASSDPNHEYSDKFIHVHTSFQLHERCAWR